MTETLILDVEQQRRADPQDDLSPGSQQEGPIDPQTAPGIGAGSCVFSSVLGESHRRSGGFKELCRRLDRTFPDRRKIEATLRDHTAGYPSLSKALAAGSGMAVLVSGNPAKSLTTSEQQKLVDFIVDGGQLVVTAMAGGLVGSNFNDVLSLFGITVNSDAVLRTAFYKYFHPKEVYISDGAVTRNVAEEIQSLGRDSVNGEDAPSHEAKGGKFDHTGIAFVYPYGCTLQLASPAVPLLSTGTASHPHNACVVAVSEDMTMEAKRARGIPLHSSVKVCRGRVMVIGSSQMLGDQWLDKEQNALVARYLFELLQPGRDLRLHKGFARAGDVSAKRLAPDIQGMAGRVRGCLQDAEDLPGDITSLFNREVFSFNTAFIPQAMRLYRRLGVPKKPLALIEPQFEQPLPALEPAVFPPAMFEPPVPPLERFDLDDAFADEHFKLSQLSLTARKRDSKADESAVDDYVIKAAHVLGVEGAAQMTAPQALLSVFDQIARWKLSDAGGEMGLFGEFDDSEGIKI